MKNILLTLLLLSPLAFAEGDLKPLYETMKKDPNDSEIAYVNTRCLALYNMQYRVTKGAKQGESAKINATAERNIKKMINISFRYWQITRQDISIEAFEKNIKSIMPPIAVIYDEAAQENWIKNGNYFKGSSLIMSDSIFCGDYMDQFPDID